MTFYNGFLYGPYDVQYKLLQPVELESEVPADSAGQKKEEKPAMAEVREAEREKQERNRTRASRQNSPKPKVEPAPPSSSGEKKVRGDLPHGS